MKNKILIFTLLFLLAGVMFSSCQKEDNLTVKPIYTYGITKSEFSSVTTSKDTDAPNLATELGSIYDAFTEAFKTSLGVTPMSYTFEYNGGKDKVIEACHNAEETLKAKAFHGSYTLEVTIVGGDVIFTWNSPKSENSEPEPPVEKLPEYTLIFYGFGGDCGDQYLLKNISDMYDALEGNEKKIKAVVQCKLSPTESLLDEENREWIDIAAQEAGISADEWAQKYGLKTFRTIVNPADDFGEIIFKNLDNYLIDDENLNIGQPQNLTDYIKWAVEQAPAKKYILAIGSHGGGYVPNDDAPKKNNSLTKGLFYDSGNNDEHLTITTLTSALRETGIKFEAFFMNCCLMNTIEYQFELKDLTNYLALSTFTMPIYGGNYEALINGLAHSDIEAALSLFCDGSLSVWDETNPGEYPYSDMTITRTSSLDAFGALWKEFTDRLIKAYTEGGEKVKSAIDEATEEGTFKIDNENPSYTLTNYAAALMDAAPTYFDDAFVKQLEQSFENCIVHNSSSAPLREADWDISCSILVGCQNHYRTYTWLNPVEAAEAGIPGIEEFNGWAIYYYVEYNADGTAAQYDNEGNLLASGHWLSKSNFEDTYMQLAFDKATGWSRWIAVNEAEPIPYSPATMQFDIYNEGFLPSE